MDTRREASRDEPGRRVEAEKTRLREAIAGTRAELSQTLGELRAVMRDQLDWRAWVARNPLTSVAVVAAIGWRVGRGRWL
jgi:hypothetical protein